MAASDLLGDASPPAALPELEALGASLRQARLAQGLSLEALAERLNMGGEQLKALENGHREGLREAVFVIAQARRIAGCLGVNVDPEIEALRRNPAFQQGGPKRPTPAAVAARSIPASAATPSPVPPTPSATSPKRRWPLGVVMAAGLLVVASAAVVRISPRLWFTSPTATPAAPPPPAPPPANDTLVLEARGPSWLEVVAADGTSLFRGTAEGRQSFPLGRGLRVLAGRPDLVTVQVGAEPARVLGPINQVRWRRFPAALTAPAP